VCRTPATEPNISGKARLARERKCDTRSGAHMCRSPGFKKRACGEAMDPVVNGRHLSACQRPSRKALSDWCRTRPLARRRPGAAGSGGGSFGAAGNLAGPRNRESSATAGRLAHSAPGPQRAAGHTFSAVRRPANHRRATPRPVERELRKIPIIVVSLAGSGDARPQLVRSRPAVAARCCA